MMFFKRKKKAKTSNRSVEKRFYNSNSKIADNFFFVSNVTAQDIVTKDYRAILHSARSMFANNSYVKGFVGTMERNVIGEKGFQLSVQTSNEQVNTQIEKAWNNWCKAHNCDSRSHSTFREICNQILIAHSIDGEAFVILEYQDQQLKLKLIDCTLIDSELNDSSQNIVNGVELNDFDEPEAYWLKSKAEDYKKIPAKQIIHIYKPSWVGQRRGISELTGVISKLEKLDEFENSALANAKNSAKFLGFVEKASNPDYAGVDDEITNDDGEVIGNTKEQVVIDDNTVAYLNENETWKQMASQYPSGEFKSFNAALLHSIATGLNISYQALTRDINGTNYSGGRTATLEDQKTYKSKQSFLISSFVEPIFKEWLRSYCAYNPHLNFKDILENIDWQSNRWQWVDPKKEADANRILNELGVKSKREIIIEMGRDPEVVFKQILKEREMFKDVSNV